MLRTQGKQEESHKASFWEIFKRFREIPGEYTEIYRCLSFPVISNAQLITFSLLIQPQNV
jgi:hypothetical protein